MSTCGGHRLCLCTFTKRVLAQLDSLKCWKKTMASWSGFHLLPTDLDEQAATLHLSSTQGGAHHPYSSAHYISVKVEDALRWLPLRPSLLDIFVSSTGDFNLIT